MVCPSCNTPNRDDAKFCKRCGQPLHSQQAIASENGLSNEVQESSEPVQEKVREPGYAPVQDVEDISIPPTLILTPEKMIAYHPRRWQEELDQEHQMVQTATAEDQAAPTTDGS